jgi:hypothetical protein
MLIVRRQEKEEKLSFWIFEKLRHLVATST